MSSIRFNVKDMLDIMKISNINHDYLNETDGLIHNCYLQQKTYEDKDLYTLFYKKIHFIKYTSNTQVFLNNKQVIIDYIPTFIPNLKVIIKNTENIVITLSNIAVKEFIFYFKNNYIIFEPKNE